MHTLSGVQNLSVIAANEFVGDVATEQKQLDDGSTYRNIRLPPHKFVKHDNRLDSQRNSFPVPLNARRFHSKIIG